LKFRPQVQLRFRGPEQFAAIKKAALRESLSVNEWILMKIEGSRETEKLVRKGDTRPAKRSAATEHHGPDAGGGSQSGSALRGEGGGSPEPSPIKVKKMSTEEFFKLSNSDQDRARREKRY